MSLPVRLALAGAAGVAVIGLVDAVTHGLTGSYSVFADDYGRSGWQVVGSLVHALMYAAIAWVLRSSGDRIDAGSRSRRVVRLALVVASVVNAVFFGVVDPALWALGVDEPPAWLAAAVAPITLVFGLTFLLAFALGITLRRVPGQRRAALLLMSIGPVLALTVLVSVVGGPLAGFAHPTYTETVTNVGLALTGLAAVTRPPTAPDLAPAGRRGTGG
jgi:hypothetical protein